jgi:hypothetical protein
MSNFNLGFDISILIHGKEEKSDQVEDQNTFLYSIIS